MRAYLVRVLGAVLNGLAKWWVKLLAAILLIPLCLYIFLLSPLFCVGLANIITCHGVAALLIKLEAEELLVNLTSFLCGFFFFFILCFLCTFCAEIIVILASFSCIWILESLIRTLFYSLLRN